MKLKYTQHKTGMDNDFLPNRVVKYWNKIPDQVKADESVAVFKARLADFK